MAASMLAEVIELEADVPFDPRCLRILQSLSWFTCSRELVSWTKATPKTRAPFIPFAAPNLKAHGAGGGSVLTHPGLNTKFTPGSLPSPKNVTALNGMTPWQMSPWTTRRRSAISYANAACA
ncbi:hypothetical protein B0H19DRAFT_1271517 [Mycena capillaripes]|nr:hypothetical protein B0H19DRAFT_1271517 [Mycena capillaripes]